VPVDDANPILATMAEHGITLDAARADADAAYFAGAVLEGHEPIPAELFPLSSEQREQVGKTSAELVRSLSQELQALLKRVRSDEAATEDFEAAYRATYGTQ
jgi:hypothetical protein